jgi:hypothetical protein
MSQVNREWFLVTFARRQSILSVIPRTSLRIPHIARIATTESFRARYFGGYGNADS